MGRSPAAAERAKLLSLEDWAMLGEDVESELVDGAIEEQAVPSFPHGIAGSRP